jgi:hypothetical protein
MKPKLLILLAALVVILFLVFYFRPCLECWFNNEYKKKTERGYQCTGEKTISVETLSGSAFKAAMDSLQSNPQFERSTVKSDRTDLVQVRFVCNELIFTPKLAGNEEDQAKMRKYLRCQGFKKDKTCACSDNLELWTYQDAGDANLIEIVKDPPKDNSGQHIGGLSLNYEIAFNDTLDLRDKYISENPPAESHPNSPQNKDYAKVVTIGVSDSGVDIDPGSPLLSNGYLWTESMLTTQPCINPGENGLSNLSPDEHPKDKNGHGTFVNGIIAGAAISNNEPQPEVTNVYYRLLNIKNSDNDTFSIFNAICGLYFGAQQGVKIFNISWGFLEENKTKAHEIFQIFLKDHPEVVLIAGMGNNGKSLDHNASFWPACLAETDNRVISVGALNAKHTALAGFSNFSLSPAKMTILAPGEKIISLAPKSLQAPAQSAVDAPPPSGLAVGSGTSFATPYVTRKVAVLSLANPDPAGLKMGLTNNATTMYGFPVLNQ